MSPTDALAQAVSECQRFRYDYAELKRLLIGQPDPPWETPAELEHEKFGLCRDFAIWTCARTLELCPESVVKIVIGQYTGGEKPTGHAWVEIVALSGEITAWADPTFNCGPHIVQWYADRVPWESWRWDGRAFVETERFERGSQ